MMEWIKRLILGRWLKSVLDKLPLDGKKTYVGLALFVLAEAASIMCVGGGGGSICAGISLAQQVLGQLGIPAAPQDVAMAALGGVLLGLYHKVLKWFHSEDELPPAKQ